MLYLESSPQVTSLSTKFMHERGGVPQLDKYRPVSRVVGAEAVARRRGGTHDDRRGESRNVIFTVYLATVTCLLAV